MKRDAKTRRKMSSIIMRISKLERERLRLVKQLSKLKSYEYRKVHI